MLVQQHQIEALVKAGVKDVVLAVNYRPEVMVALLSKLEEQYDIKITFSVESEPLGTGTSQHSFQRRSLTPMQLVLWRWRERSSARTTRPSSSLTLTSPALILSKRCETSTSLTATRALSWCVALAS